MRVAAPWVKDAAGAMSGDAVQYALSRTEDGWRLVMSVDRAWLQAPERAFPVVVDPTVTVANQYACYLNSDAGNESQSYCGLDSLGVGPYYSQEYSRTS